MLEAVWTSRGAHVYILGLPKGPGLLEQSPKGD